MPLKGQKWNPESSKKRIISFQKTLKEKYPEGRPCWNKGLTKATDIRVLRGSIKQAEVLKQTYKNNPSLIKKINETKKRKFATGEIVVWCKGLTKENNQSLQKTSKALKGKPKSKEHRKKLSLSLLGRTFIDIHGEKKANEIKIKQAIKHKGSKRKDSTKQKQREKALKRVNKQGNMIAYNEKSIPFFNYINNKYNLKGVYGKNEFKCIGYSLDYYDKSTNLVIEWDEKYHYPFSTLRKKDVTRQENIINHLNCEFIRIKQWEDLNQYEELIKLFIINKTIRKIA
jgi:hypothetical protein